ncbi:MAG: translesion error-prone DNA polymerase V autoproteolytic subunit [Bacteroidota bacterium]
MSNQKKIKSSVLEIFAIENGTELELTLVNTGISAGFPSPAMDFDENKIDLNRHLIKRPASTFFGRVKGNSMEGAGIYDGNLLIIDKSIKPKSEQIAVCFIDGEFTIKRIRIEKDCIWLIPANDSYQAIRVNEDNNFLIWGIVIYVIRAV